MFINLLKSDLIRLNDVKWHVEMNVLLVWDSFVNNLLVFGLKIKDIYVAVYCDINIAKGCVMLFYV